MKTERVEKLLSVSKILFLFSCFISFSLPGNTQTAMPGAFPLKSDTSSQILIPDQYLQVLEDKNASYSLHRVTSEPLSLRFHSKGMKAPGLDTNGVHQYWLRYRIQNTMLKTAKVSLQVRVNYHTVYLKQNSGKWKQFRSGVWQPAKFKEGLKSASAIPLEIGPGETVEIIESRYNVADTNFKTPVGLMSTQKLIEEFYIDELDNGRSYFTITHVQEGFLIGVLLIAAAFAFFFYRVMHERLNLYFSLFLFFLAINRTYNIAFAYIYHEKPWLEQSGRAIAFAWLFILTFMLYFFREAYRSKKDFPKYDRYLEVLTYLNIFGYLFFFLFNMILGLKMKLFFAVNQLMIAAIPLSLLILGLMFVRGKRGSDRWMFWAGFPFLLFYGVVTFLASAIQAFNVQNEFTGSFLRTIFSNYRPIEIVLLVWFTLIFSGLLALRYSLLRKENAQQQLDLEHAALEREREKNALMMAQKEHLEKEVAERTAELQTSLQNLKSTQAQLIHAEKMASLGELTAGIAHEIQNPLNFVNNFSEVNTELIEELKTELRAGNAEDALAIADDLGENESRINLHGKRADAIVKGMLQHSRANSGGVKELTDINSLVDEFTKLAYHGFRTKEKFFHAELQTDYDHSIGNIPLVPQDIGRVLLNIINNALYAVWQKQKQADAGFVPEISIATKNLIHSIEVRVSDNGTGIPEDILKKVFQPFFTTKPTGEGTGLGLSLSFDIVSKAHGGNLFVTSTPGKGSTFIIELPR